ncbi:putative transcription factor interactor and regulator Znf-B family [Helianthus debilis subsp. tardiflorus]
MKRCELCRHIARMCCQSDNAILCYDCDQNVHSANFLVAKHSRTLLCHKCQSPTPWTASGLHLGRAATVCVDCLDEDLSRRRVQLGRETSHQENHNDRERDDESIESFDESVNDDEDAENQVVPWASVASPPVAASSTGEEFSSSGMSLHVFPTPSVTKRKFQCKNNAE